MAVHVLAVLAYKDGACVPSSLLAASVNTNPVIIRRLLLALQAAGLVQTRKGPGFGSRLSRAPGRINLAEVYRAVEGEQMFANPRRQPNSACPVGHGIHVALRQVVVSAQTALERDLAGRNLAEVLATIKRNI
jgi:DNA-binding IscR family transcriptional regulator